MLGVLNAFYHRNRNGNLGSVEVANCRQPAELCAFEGRRREEQLGQLFDTRVKQSAQQLVSA